MWVNGCPTAVLPFLTSFVRACVGHPFKPDYFANTMSHDYLTTKQTNCLVFMHIFSDIVIHTKCSEMFIMVLRGGRDPEFDLPTQLLSSLCNHRYPITGPEINHSSQSMMPHIVPLRWDTATLKWDLSLDAYHMFDVLKARLRKCHTLPTHTIQLLHHSSTLSQASAFIEDISDLGGNWVWWCADWPQSPQHFWDKGFCPQKSSKDKVYGISVPMTSRSPKPRAARVPWHRPTDCEL